MSILITYWLHGRNGVKHLLRGVIHWRVAPGYYVIALLAVPVLTVLLSFLTGTFRQLPDGWVSMIWNYSYSVITIVLLINLWEELGWTGFVQNKLMQYKGLLHGSLLTAPGFVAIHIPLIFDDPNLTVVLTDFIAVVVLSIFFRYLLGMIFLDTQGSILIVGLLHASQNSANDLEAVTGEYEMILAVIILTLIIAVYRVMCGKSAVSGSLPDLHVKNKRKID
jgi:membrane protease YdiL (CAAX protease family)